METPLPEFYLYVDVDDTLIRSYSTKRMPISKSIDYIKKMKEQGATLYCWSSGGAEYARRSAEELGIAEIFSAFLPKPHIVLDDQKIDEWRYLIQIHPMAIKSDKLEYYRNMLDNRGI
jgi:hypothetical protein